MAKTGMLVFSPPSRNDTDKENHVPILSFTWFSKPPVVSFGTVKVGSSKSALLRVENPSEEAEVTVRVEGIGPGKGFAIDHSEFTVQPESTFSLSLTWTPVKEGGVRELIYFNAGGPGKYQAVLLGTAQDPHNKKKSLWETLKSGRESGKIGRRPRRPGGPPSVLCPTVKPGTSGNVSARSDLLGRNGKIKGVSKAPSKTRVPLGTQERLRNLMPSVQSEMPLLSTLSSQLTETQVPSLKEALAAIQSDLDISSSCEFSDSLESDRGNHGLPDSPKLININEQRLTFFVSQTGLGPEAKAENVKVRFTSATVTKGKAPVEMVASRPSERTVKKSRRRLLDKTLELSFSSSDASSPRAGTPSLPVIDSASGRSSCDGDQVLKSSPSTSQSESISGLITLSGIPFGCSSSPATASIQLPLCSSSPLHCSMLLGSPSQEPTATVSECPSVKEDLFPRHSTLNTKKRKSEEHLHNHQNVGKVPKRTQVETQRLVQEKKGVTPGQRKAGSVCSTSTRKIAKSRVAAQAKQSSSRATSQSTGSVKRTRVVAVAQSKLTFIKPVQTALPRHPMPFAAKNMFYDERWMEKQERGFTWWINYVLTPDDFKVNNEVNKDTAVSLAIAGKAKLNAPEAPTKEEMSFSTYTARRKLNRLRRSACQMFMSEAMAKAIQRLELEVEAGRLRVRPDRHLWKDIGERKKVLNWLLSYNPLWLRIGLETIFGEMISLHSNSDTLGLAMFILQRLLWNPDIAAKFRHSSVAHLYKDGHEEALSRFTLKKLLLLVCFLDKAKESRLIEHNPCLFCVDAEFKTSKDLLLAFSRDFLSGEGILPRHLGHLGLPVSHAQKPLDEFNFAVKNLAVDLRCGVRLVRVMELFLQDWSLSKKLRMPTISRLQKVHNVDIALQALRSKGVDLKDERGSTIESRDIVDGHREKTLGLLWRILLAFHLDVILNEDDLREEIGFLKDTIRTKRRFESLKGDQGPQPDAAEETVLFEHSSRKITLLMDWVCAVCDFYRLKVDNFTVAFSDGRVLCYLIHHYHPGLLPAEAVSHSTTQTVECSVGGHLELDHSSNDPDASLDCLTTGLTGTDSQLFDSLLKNEKNNFRAFNTALAYLGGVPGMMNPADMSNTIPNEKVVISHLSFLCARLLDLRKESRAARVIQGAWRKHKIREELKLYKERNMAAVKIQKAVRSFIERRRAVRQNRAAVTIQSLWRGYTVRNQMRLKREAGLRAEQHEAATIIQAHWRRFSVRRAYLRLKHCAIVIEARWKMKRAFSEYRKLRHAATVIQKYSRAWALSKRDRADFLSLRAAVVTIQRGYRRWKAQKTHQEDCAAKVIQSAFKKWYEERMARKSAAVRIQSWYRMKMSLQKYRATKRSAVLIQARYRGSGQRRCFQMMKVQHSSAIVIQSAFRGYVVRKQVSNMEQAAVLIQRRFRACLLMNMERKMFLRMRCAAVIIQAAYRGKVSRDSLKERDRAATVIQAAFRRYAVQRRYRVLQKAAVMIQRKYRATVLAHRLKHKYEALRNAALTVQSHWRGRADRKRLEKYNECATLIQSCYRRHTAQLEFRSKKAAAVVLQQHYRAFVAGREMRNTYLQKKAACLALQTAFRGMRVRMELRRKHQAATVIQSSVRMFLCKKTFLLLQRAAVVIQSRYRALLLCRAQHNEFTELKKSAIKIQAAFRGYRVRENLRKRHNAATVIQALFRMYRTRMAYLALKCAAIILQDRYRAKVLKDRQIQTYRAMKCAAVVLQAAYRGHLVRRKVAEMHRAATLIQRKFVTTRERRRFLAVKAAALICQRTYRAVTLARKERFDYLSKLKAAVCLQAAYRGFKARKQLRIKQAAAVQIQSHFRKYQQRRNFVSLRWASSVLQARYRANKQMRADMLSLRVKRDAATVLQAAFRGMKTRQVLQQRHRAATVIQRAHRAHREREHYRRLKSSVLTVQRRYRANVVMKKQRKVYEQTLGAVIILQSVYRGRLVRKDVACQHHAATVIQSAFRKQRDFLKFQAMQRSAIVIQRHYRSCTQRHKALLDFRSKKAAAVVLQQHYRAFVAGREMRNTYLQKKAACLALQTAFRGMRVRMELRRKHQAATVIQSSVRMFLCKKTYLLLQSATVVIQSRYRALLLCRAQHNEFTELKKSAIKIQAAFRGYRVRENLRKRHNAATVIQALFRMYRTRMAYLALKCAAIILQDRYRAKVLKDRQIQTYRAMKCAAVVLQAAYRGHLVRRKVAEMHRAATLIQRKFVTTRERRRFLAVKAAALICQRTYRAVTLARKERFDYLSKLRAAVCLQAAYRGFKARKQLRIKQAAAVQIQSHFRKYQQRRNFVSLRWASSVLQARYRANKQMRADMLSLRVKRDAAIVLQAAFRGMKTRQVLQQRHRAATVIQRAHRAHREHDYYSRLKSSVLTVQRRYRANVAMKKQRKVYEQTLRAVIILQSMYRGRLVRKDVACQHHAATVIQSAFRKQREFLKFQAMRRSAIVIQRHYRSCTQRHKAQLEFRSKKAAAVVLQQHYRAFVAGREMRNTYLQKKAACLALQTAFRGMRVRMELRRKHQAATVIQSSVRMFLCKKTFLLLQRAAVVIQSRYRALLLCRAQHNEFTELKKSAIKIQAAFRGYRVRENLRKRHNASTVIQARFRMYRTRTAYLSLKCAAIILQDRYRAKVLKDRQIQTYRAMKCAAVVLQAAYRGHLVRRKVAEMHRAATLIQRKFVTTRERRRFLAVKAAALICQRRYRAVTLARKERFDYLSKLKAAVCLQAAYRGFKARKQLRIKQAAAVQIQSHFRKYQQRRNFVSLRWASSVLQARYRANKQMRADMLSLRVKRDAAIVLQAAFRGMKTRQVLQQRHRAATVIQRAHRAHREHDYYRRLKSSVLTVQRRYRANVAMKKQRKVYEQTLGAVIILQSVYRGRLVRKDVACQHHAATVIQSAFRKQRDFLKFQDMWRSAIVIQRHYRFYKLQRHEREKFLELKQSVTILQAAFRAWRVTRDIRQRNQAALVIQSCWKGSVQRRIFQTKKAAAVKLQQMFRAVLLARAEKTNYIRKRKAAVTLQKHCRAWITRREELEAAQAERRLRFSSAAFHHLGAIKIQRALRAHLALKSAKRQIHNVVTIQRWVRARWQRKQFLEDRRKVVQVQRAVRRRLACRVKAACIIQQAVRRFLLVRRQKRAEQGITKAQALWRGHRSRRLNDNPKLVALRHRLRQVTAAAREEDKLINKTLFALDHLLHYKQFSYILEALKNLETTTRLSPECCEHLLGSGVTNVLFILIRSCNRSIASMEVITFSVQILLNLSKYHKTIDMVYSVENSVETLLDLLQRYRDKAGDKAAGKGGSIFTKACFILAILLQDQRHAGEVLKQPSVVDRVRSIYHLTVRKHKMDAERAVIKNKMSASNNRAHAFTVTPHKSRPQPKFAPDWVLGRDKLKDINDPLRAIQMVAEALFVV